MFFYQCKRCNHKSNQKVEIRRHLDRKFKCSKNIDVFNYDDNILYEFSLIKHKINDDFNLLNILTDKCHNNIIKTLSVKKELSEIKENKQEYYCKNCDLFFQNRSNLNRHIKKNNCKSNIVNNITNNNTLNQQNIININLNLIKPFDEDWDVSTIDTTLKNILLMSKLKYTKTLEHILNNDINLNVILHDELNTGIVYKNDKERFKHMNINDIVDKSMEKLHKHLHFFHEEVKDKNEYQINDEYFDEEKDIIDKKYDDYKNNKNIQLKVQEYITKIYNNKRNETLKIYQEILNENEKNLIEGY